MLLDDLRHAVRRLRAQPGTAIVAAGMLALAIGSTSAMFAIVDHLLLRPVPFRDPRQLVWLFVGTGPTNMMPYVSRETVRAWRSSPAFSEVHAFVQESGAVAGEHGLSARATMWVTPGTFEMLGVSPRLGRTFAPDEGRAGADDLVVISEKVWRQDFGADPQIIGRRVLISGRSTSVVGVMPGGFHFPSWQIDLWRPYDLDHPPAAVAARPITAYARLTATITPADAAAFATTAANAIEPLRDGRRVILRGVAAGFLDSYSRSAITALAVGVGLVFVVLCANVSNLILARTTSRRQECGVCSALGASRGRLLWQAFLENALVSVVAAGGGLFTAWVLVSLTPRVVPEELLVRTLNPVQIDWRVVAATVVLATAATLGAALPPAWIGTSLNPVESMRSTGRAGTETRAARAWTQSLLIAEVALATALIVAAGVLGLSFLKLMAVSPGLDVQRVMTASIALPDFAFANRAARSAFAQELLRRVHELPGVTDVALSDGVPPEAGGSRSDPVQSDVAGVPEQRLDVLSYEVQPEFFRVYGIALMEGRVFQAGDGADRAIVSEQLARLLWPGVSPLGHTFTFKGSAPYHVVGVTREVRSSTLLDPLDDLPEFYTPATMGGRQVSLGLRCAAVCPDDRTIRERIRAAGSNAIVSSLAPLETAYLSQFSRPRAASHLGLVFAAIAMLAAGSGLFSVLSYTVGRRRREFGIRLAMGAQPQEVRRLVLRDGLGVAIMGLVFGAAVGWMLCRALMTLTFGVTIGDPLVWSITIGAILAATLLACWSPATAAMRTDPLLLLHDE